MKSRLFLLLVLLIIHVLFNSHVNTKDNVLVKTKPSQFTVDNLKPQSPTPSITPTSTPAPKKVLGTQTSGGFCLTVPILIYHHIEPLALATKAGHAQLTVDNTTFEKQMASLSSLGYTTVTIEQIVNALINHTPLPNKSIAITLDDGYADAYTYAYPIAQKYHILLNLMIPTGLLQNVGYLAWNQLKEMVGSGQVTAYNHTWSHANLAAASKDKIEQEILTAKKQLEQNLGKSTNIFTYPYGGENQNVRDILQKNGFIAALSTLSGFTQCDSFLMNLHRNRIGNGPLTSYGIN